MSYLAALAMGAVAGLRSMAAPALVSHRLSRSNRGRRLNGPLAFLSRPEAAAVLGVLAAGEIAADKTPWIPDRVSPPALLGRCATGALVGAALGNEDGCRPEAGGLLGALGAFTSTHAAYYLRRELGEQLGVPDPLLGVIEDLVVVGAGLTILEAAFREDGAG